MIGDPFQYYVSLWVTRCFGPEVALDKIERNHRFLEEALETVQANGCSREEAIALVDYVFDRPVGKLNQEVGGALVTLAALCAASNVDMEAAGHAELVRIERKLPQIREKHLAKRSRELALRQKSPLP